MIRAYIHLVLGKIGRMLLELYTSNSVAINALVILYGLVALYAHENLRRAIREMESMMVEIARSIGEEVDYERVYSHFVQRWQTEKQGKRVFLPSLGDLWFELTRSAELIDLLSIGPQYVRMTLHKRIGEPKAEAFDPVDYRRWEQYRHHLLIGLRGNVPGHKEATELEAEERYPKPYKESRK